MRTSTEAPETSTGAASSPLVNERFGAAARRFATRPALVFEDAEGWCSYSYGSLARRADALAAALTESGVGAGASVGIAAVRHPDTIAAMIATLTVGGRYVPLDPAYPADRLRTLCDEAEVALVVSAGPDSRCEFPVAVLDAEAVADPVDGATTAASVPGDPEAPAYVMFTSGSTGIPKGVVVPHRAIVRLVDDPDYMRLNHETVFLHLAPQSFDASTLEIWGALLNGGTCVLFPHDQLPTAAGLKTVIEAAGVNAMWLTASLFNAVVDRDPDCLAGVRDLLTGGEALSVPHVMRALERLPGTRLVNGYGPTENTTFTTCYPIPPAFAPGEHGVPIGAPVRGTDVMIVDEALRAVEPGTVGELVALGSGLALGYLGAPELTAERFVDVTCADGRSARGYRTGDRVVKRADGLLEFVGRLDDQVKIEGHRIEPGEIERVIADLPGVRQCRVRVTCGATGTARLAAYVVGDASIRETTLRAHLADRVPAFMVPHHFCLLDALPLNANGKLDHAALPPPGTATAKAGAGASPSARSGPLAAVGEAWGKALGHDSISDDANFFDAGGTSLDAVKLHELLEAGFARRLEPTFVFEHATIRRQAEALATTDRQPAARDQGRGALRRQVAVRRGRGR